MKAFIGLCLLVLGGFSNVVLGKTEVEIRVASIESFEDMGNAPPSPAKLRWASARRCWQFSEPSHLVENRPGCLRIPKRYHQALFALRGLQSGTWHQSFSALFPYAQNILVNQARGSSLKESFPTLHWGVAGLDDDISLDIVFPFALRGHDGRWAQVTATVDLATLHRAYETVINPAAAYASAPSVYSVQGRKGPLGPEVTVFPNRVTTISGKPQVNAPQIRGVRNDLSRLEREVLDQIVSSEIIVLSVPNTASEAIYHQRTPGLGSPVYFAVSYDEATRQALDLKLRPESMREKWGRRLSCAASFIPGLNVPTIFIGYGG